MALSGFQNLPSWLPVADLLLKATVVLVLAMLATTVLRRASAATRHMIWTVSLLAVLALPMFSAFLPAWNVPVIEISRPEVSPATRIESAPAVALEPAAVTAVPPSRDKVARDTSQAAPTERSRDRVIPWFVWAVSIWAAGALFIVARLVVGTIAVHHAARKTTVATGAPWLPLAEGLAGDLDVSNVTFRRSDGSTMPMTWGVWRPVVLMPAEADAWPVERLRIVLLHELAHVKRNDCMTHFLAQAACAVYWMNPLAWLAAARARAERERACDDLVLAAGTPGADYAAQLLDIARVMRAGRLSSAMAHASLAMAHRTQLEGRLMAILDPSVPRAGITRVRTSFAAAVAFVMLTPLASLQPWAHAQTPSPAPAPTPRPTPAPSPAPPEQPRERSSADARSLEQNRKASAAAVERTVETAVASTIEALPELIGTAMESALTAAAAALQETKPTAAKDAKSTAGRDPKVIAALTEALKDSDKEVRESAMHALVRLRDPAVFEPLVLALRDASEDVREQAAFGLGQLRDRRAVEPLKAALKDSSASVREQVVFALGQLRDGSSIDGLTLALRDASASVREQAAFALGQLRDERAVEGLTIALKDANDSVREQAAFALGQLRARGAVDALIIALRDSDPDVREQSAFALGQIGDSRAIDALTAALKDANAEVRQHAAFALGQLIK